MGMCLVLFLLVFEGFMFLKFWLVCVAIILSCLLAEGGGGRTGVNG